MEWQTCPICGGQMIRDTRRVPYHYRGQTIDVDQPGDWCADCGEGLLSAADRQATEMAVRTLWAQAEGLLPPDEVRRIRRKLHLNQRQAATIFGGGVNAFSRYERGEATPVRAVDNLLRLLDRHPELLRELQ